MSKEALGGCVALMSKVLVILVDDTCSPYEAGMALLLVAKETAWGLERGKATIWAHLVHPALHRNTSHHLDKCRSSMSL